MTQQAAQWVQLNENGRPYIPTGKTTKTDTLINLTHRQVQAQHLYASRAAQEGACLLFSLKWILLTGENTDPAERIKQLGQRHGAESATLHGIYTRYKANLPVAMAQKFLELLRQRDLILYEKIKHIPVEKFAENMIDVMEDCCENEAQLYFLNSIFETVIEEAALENSGLLKQIFKFLDVTSGDSIQLDIASHHLIPEIFLTELATQHERMICDMGVHAIAFSRHHNSVNVFDPNEGEFKIPIKEFGRFMTAFLLDHGKGAFPPQCRLIPISSAETQIKNPADPPQEKGLHRIYKEKAALYKQKNE